MLKIAWLLGICYSDSWLVFAKTGYISKWRRSIENCYGLNFINLKQGFF